MQDFSPFRRWQRRLLPVFVTLALVSSASGQDDSRLAESRDLTMRFAGEMQGALQSAMASGGPVAAVSACKVIAPGIAARLSDESGAMVSRTSLRVRNPANAADDWQREALTLMDADPARTEVFEATEDGGFRYMKAIPTASLCLNCHGTVIAPDIRRVLAEEYPDDEATGYYLGDVRGAFSVVWPAGD